MDRDCKKQSGLSSGQLCAGVVDQCSCKLHFASRSDQREVPGRASGGSVLHEARLGLGALGHARGENLSRFVNELPGALVVS